MQDTRMIRPRTSSASTSPPATEEFWESSYVTYASQVVIAPMGLQVAILAVVKGVLANWLPWSQILTDCRQVSLWFSGLSPLYMKNRMLLRKMSLVIPILRTPYTVLLQPSLV
jgi:hypothetical protein